MTRVLLYPVGVVLGAAWFVACGRAPIVARPAPPTRSSASQPAGDPCAPPPAGAAPAALERSYSGLARGARCKAELIETMTQVSAALGVRCTYCHLEADYGAATKRKQIANWMATELAPALRMKHGKQSVSCGDCHRSRGRGEARLLGTPRSESLAIEWMTRHMNEDFVRADGKALRCKTCHEENLGSPGFRRQLLLSHLPGLSSAPPSSAPVEASLPSNRPSQAVSAP